uniref:Uncharacterized protein n=1 Tax=Podarcis muralis TaxID=64176 RepID=A0A670JEC3_PODMU
QTVRGSAVSSDFNIIDTETPVFFRGDKASQFGYRVVQTRADDGTSWLVVSAPMSGNRTGSLFRCSYDTEKCQPVVLHHNSKLKICVIHLKHSYVTLTAFAPLKESWEM